MKKFAELLPPVDSRRGALMRAALAGILLVVAILLVMSPTPSQDPAIDMPAPNSLAETPLIPQPAPEPQPALPLELPVPQSAPEPEAAEEPAAEAAAEAPPAEPAPAEKPAEAATPKPEKPAAAKPAPRAESASGRAPRHELRLGDFVPLGTARELQSAASLAGQPVRVMHRVVVGPFASRDAALAAQKGLAGTRTLPVPGASNSEWWLQAGAFAEVANAEALSKTLSERSQQVAVQGRVQLGPYPDRAAAEQALSRMRTDLGQRFERAEIIQVR